MTVLGICEFDPGVPDTAMLSVSPAGENASEKLVLSTLGHELGHAIFDAPGWIVDASKGTGLFDGPNGMARKASRTTRVREHAKPGEGRGSVLACRKFTCAHPGRLEAPIHNPAHRRTHR